ncbi:MAG: hypothetical protein IH585_04980 [Anaerolineaceae bacterium]|nr:hypothetical protein [Anaerolineaceae bacterium]
MDKKNKLNWISWIVLAGLYVVSIYLMGYEHLVNPTEPRWIIVTNLALISVPLILFYGSIGLILTALRQKESKGIINLRLSRFLYFTPRIAGILMILFVSLFALDVFTAGGNFWRQLLGFLFHAAPAVILAILMFFAWRKPLIGFIIFGLAAIAFLRFVIMGGDFAAGNFLMFVAPLALISGLFWINWKWKDAMTLGKAVGK